MIKILDCTLRDGGYYTNWDFESTLVQDYLVTMNKLPIEYIEIGYRQPAKKEYFGEYAYLPLSTISQCKQYAPNKKLAVMLNLKDINEQTAIELLSPLRSLVSLVRIATDPKDIEKVIVVAKKIREQGFLVSVNVMYMSKWDEIPVFWQHLNGLNGAADFVCLVDSYGAIYPNEIPSLVSRIKKELIMPLGFHGHNNLSLAFANTLAAIQAGCEMVDSTIMGMGRGAGNLQTELLLTYLAKGNERIDLNKIVDLRNSFERLYELFHWGTNLPYMISGVNSLPQKDIMTMLSQRRYSVSSIVRYLQHKLKQLDLQKYQLLEDTKVSSPILLIGGGDSVYQHIRAIRDLINQHTRMPICFLSAKHLHLFADITNPRYLCLVGNEGVRVERQIQYMHLTDKLVLSKQGDVDVYVPDGVCTQTYVLEKNENEGIVDLDAPLKLAIEITRQVTSNKTILLVGFDGYSASKRDDMYDMMHENQIIFEYYSGEFHFRSLLPTEYANIEVGSIYAELSR